MNVTTVKNALSRRIGRSGLLIKKYSPEILLGVGLVGGVVAAVMAAKATLKVESILETHRNQMESIETAREEKSELYSERDEMEDRARVFVQTGLSLTKLYGPSIGIGVLSITSILASHGIMQRRQVAIVAAYNLLQEGFQSYRARVVEELGEEKDRAYSLGLYNKEVEELDYNDADGEMETTAIVTKANGKVKSIYSRFFDESNPQFRKDRTLNKAFLIAQQNYLNDVLIIRGHVFLNEVYEALGFPHTKEGAVVGWVLKSPQEMKAEKRDGHIDFGIWDVENDNADREFVNGTNTSILLDFNVDGVIFDLI